MGPRRGVWRAACATPFRLVCLRSRVTTVSLSIRTVACQVIKVIKDESGERRPDEGYDSRLKNSREETTHWPAREVRGKHGSTTEFETALPDNFAEWEPQWSKRYRDQNGMETIRVARIDVVATIPGSNELQWLDVTIRRPTALTNMEGSARMGGHAATQAEREKTKKYGNSNEVGPDSVKPISIELGGRPGTQAISVSQSLTTKLAEALGGELNAATALRKMRLVVDRTLIRAEADALNAANAHEKGARRERARGSV